MAANYDNAARFYDWLSRLVYGSRLIEAQQFLISYIQAGSRILIAGGGTGRILDDIVKLHPAGLVITYVEISANMMRLSKQRNTGSNRLNFINDAVENLPDGDLYDVILTPFLLDNFAQDTLQTVFASLHHRLKPGGLWLNADFQLTGSWWQALLLKAMFIFFRLLGCVQVTRLPAIDAEFKKYLYQAAAQKTSFKGFIKSSVYHLRQQP